MGRRQEAPPTVLFLTSDWSAPAGGIRVVYRHVDILNEAGIPAAVLHERPGFRIDWFAHQTRVEYASNRQIGPADLLVVSELDVGIIATRRLPVRHVVLNQSGWLTWQYDRAAVAAHYEAPNGPLAVVTVSDYAAELLTLAFPSADIRKIRPGLDTAIFSPSEVPGGRTIGYMPRRSADDAAFLGHLVGRQLADLGWRLSPIAGLDQVGVAARMRQDSIFCALSQREGFGLPSAEAMACGNYVVGFHGYGGREFIRPEFARPVESGDLVGLAQALLEAVALEAAQPGWLAQRGREAANYIRSNFGPSQEVEDVLRVYPGLL
ncbi:MAG: glycosyltransferase [Candidatus Nanopelagicales bacterium]